MVSMIRNRKSKIISTAVLILVGLFAFAETGESVICPQKAMSAAAAAGAVNQVQADNAAVGAAANAPSALAMSMATLTPNFQAAVIQQKPNGDASLAISTPVNSILSTPAPSAVSQMNSIIPQTTAVNMGVFSAIPVGQNSGNSAIAPNLQASGEFVLNGKPMAPSGGSAANDGITPKNIAEVTGSLDNGLLMNTPAVLNNGVPNNQVGMGIPATNPNITIAPNPTAVSPTGSNSESKPTALALAAPSSNNRLGERDRENSQTPDGRNDEMRRLGLVLAKDMKRPVRNKYYKYAPRDGFNYGFQSRPRLSSFFNEQPNRRSRSNFQAAANSGMMNSLTTAIKKISSSSSNLMNSTFVNNMLPRRFRRRSIGSLAESISSSYGAAVTANNGNSGSAESAYISNDQNVQDRAIVSNSSPDSSEDNTEDVNSNDNQNDSSPDSADDESAGNDDDSTDENQDSAEPNSEDDATADTRVTSAVVATRSDNADTSYNAISENGMKRRKRHGRKHSKSGSFKGHKRRNHGNRGLRNQYSNSIEAQIPENRGSSQSQAVLADSGSTVSSAYSATASSN